VRKEEGGDASCSLREWIERPKVEEDRKCEEGRRREEGGVVGRLSGVESWRKMSDEQRLAAAAAAAGLLAGFGEGHRTARGRGLGCFCC
jgi:hypothetical protein